MPERRPATDDVLMRWMRTEVTKINEGIVTESKSLAQLLQEEKPTSITKNGNEYAFDTDVLKLSQNYTRLSNRGYKIVN
ncbi:MAG: DUF61 family protein [Methanolobus sp.]|uniref:DUF61 family protein n=1 Tax=Methanolobus sp. TaxID=1874737 RepID=UPI002731CECD|nr:DUF61 family protein [Methanolobus sp.]MDP2218039.1 DUF61 family protein [Methanolobus sp.]